LPVIDNRIDQKLDIAGSLNQATDLIKSEEPLELGSRIPGQLGFNASIVLSGGILTVSGLTGFNNQAHGHFITLFGCANQQINRHPVPICRHNAAFAALLYNETHLVRMAWGEGKGRYP